MDPVTVMTCIQVASSVSEMFAPKGPGIADLLAIQTEMLKNISKQIEVLQKGINTIIEDIDDLKQFVTYKLPSEIYKTFVTNNLLAKFSGYDEAIYSYIYDRQSSGILYSYQYNKENLLKTLDSIQEIRNQLFLHNDYFLASIIARCFKIEIDLMIILYKEDITKGRFEASFMAYEEWLSKMYDKENEFSVEFNINALKTNITDSISKCLGFSVCTDTNLEVKNEQVDTSFGYERRVFINAKANYYSFKRAFNNSFEAQLIKIGSTKEELISMYNELDIDLLFLPSQISQTVDGKLNEENIQLKFIDEYYPEQENIAAYNIKSEISNDDFHVERKYLIENKCSNSSNKLFTKVNFFSAEADVISYSKQIVVPITHKKIMLNIQNQIDYLKLKI